MRVFGSSTLQPVPGGTDRTPLSSGYRVKDDTGVTYLCVIGVLKVCYRGVNRVLKGSYMGFTKSCRYVTRELQG